MAETIANKGVRYFSKALKVFTALEFLAGASLIILALVLGSGFSTDTVILCFWVLGILSIITAFFGFIAAGRSTVRCCLGSFLILSGVLLVCQGAFVLYLFVSPDKAVDDIMDGKQPTDAVHNSVYYGRWVLLGLLGAEAAACLIALFLRFCVWREDRYHEFVDDQQAYDEREANIEAQLAKLSSKVQKNNQSSLGKSSSSRRQQDKDLKYVDGTSIKAVVITPEAPNGKVVTTAPTQKPSAAGVYSPPPVDTKGYLLSHKTPPSASALPLLNPADRKSAYLG